MIGKLPVKFARLQVNEDTRIWTEFETTDRTKESAFLGLVCVMLVLLIYSVSSVGLGSAPDILVISLFFLSTILVGITGWRHRTKRIRKFREREAVLRESNND